MAAMALLATGAAVAVPVSPVSYSMPNGYSGTYQYWDQSYTGSGCVTCNGSSLSGGLGDLTDGVIATSSWTVVEAPAGNGPYVGWSIDPSIRFQFGSLVSFTSATFYLDDGNGAGGVAMPSQITVNGMVFNVSDPAGSGPAAFTASGFNFTGTELVVSINRRSSWMFLSEVTFDNAAPEPGSLALLSVALGPLLWSRRRRT